VKTLVIAEKPSVARDIAKALGKFKDEKDYLENEEYVISWSLGHICELYEPEDYNKKLSFWTLQDLPIIPEEFKFKPKKKQKIDSMSLKNSSRGRISIQLLTLVMQEEKVN
jgi:Topoisomerase IA